MRSGGLRIKDDTRGKERLVESVRQRDGKLKGREERVRMADMLRGKEAVAGLTIPEIRTAITQARRSVSTKELEGRTPRTYTMGGAVAEICERPLFWEGRESRRCASVILTLTENNEAVKDFYSEN